MIENTPSPAAQHKPNTEPTTAPKIHAVDAGHGLTWIADAFDLFKQSAGMWILMTIMIAVISIVLTALGPLAIAINILAPILTGGLMLGCRDQSQGQELHFEHLFAGFREHTGQLATVGALYLLGSIAVVVLAIIVALGTGGASALMAAIGGNHNAAALAGLGVGFLMALLVFLAAAIPLIMALWFAPALVVFHNVAAIDAMKQSFSACLRNIFPFLLWGVMFILLGIVGVVTLGLGFLVIIPVQIISIYTAYKDIFAVA